MSKSTGQHGNTTDRNIDFQGGLDDAAIQLKDKWPYLYDCIDWSRISESSIRILEGLTSIAADFASISSGGRGELYRQAQLDPSIRNVGIRQLFEFVSPNQNLANLSPEYKILDVLGGDGVLARAIRTLVPPALIPSVLTSDLSEDMVAAAQAYGLFSIRQTAQNLFLKDQAMNGVIIAYGTHHIPIEHRTQVCLEAFRVLKPSGRIVFHDFETGSPISRWFSDVVDTYSITGHKFPHFTSEEIRDYLFDASFINLNVRHLYDPFIIYANSADEVKRKFAEYLLNMYGLTKLINKYGYEESLVVVYSLACEYFIYNQESSQYYDKVARSQIHIGKENDRWFLEAPRVALVGSGTRPW